MIFWNFLILISICVTNVTSYNELSINQNSRERRDGNISDNFLVNVRKRRYIHLEGLLSLVLDTMLQNGRRPCYNQQLSNKFEGMGKAGYIRQAHLPAASNGCGSNNYIVTPDILRYKLEPLNFCCDQHDWCYQRCDVPDQLTCDRNFLNCLKKRCPGSTANEKVDCHKNVAHHMYNMVRMVGAKLFCNAENVTGNREEEKVFFPLCQVVEKKEELTSVTWFRKKKRIEIIKNEDYVRQFIRFFIPKRYQTMRYNKRIPQFHNLMIELYGGVCKSNMSDNHQFLNLNLKELDELIFPFTNHSDDDLSWRLLSTKILLMSQLYEKLDETFKENLKVLDEKNILLNFHQHVNVAMKMISENIPIFRTWIKFMPVNCTKENYFMHFLSIITQINLLHSSSVQPFLLTDFEEYQNRSLTMTGVDGIRTNYVMLRRRANNTSLTIRYNSCWILLLFIISLLSSC
ncbi:hypothetical protein SNEBB_011332 [Seison nebaliae]|nr:hypothetical protein SNEBB_011332 [Seison nebaliae]